MHYVVKYFQDGCEGHLKMKISVKLIGGESCNSYQPVIIGIRHYSCRYSRLFELRQYIMRMLSKKTNEYHTWPFCFEHL